MINLLMIFIGHYPVHGHLFEEGLVSSFTQDIGYIDSYSSKRQK